MKIVLVIFILLGVLAIAVYYVYQRSMSNVQDKRKLLESFKRNGKKIPVDLLKCEIRTNNYIEEQELYGPGTPYGTDIQFANALLGDEMDNVKKVEINQSVIEYQHEGKKYYSHVIPKDKTTLLFLLDFKKETFIYVDPGTGDYYFDLEFLNDKEYD